MYHALFFDTHSPENTFFCWTSKACSLLCKPFASSVSASWASGVLIQESFLNGEALMAPKSVEPGVIVRVSPASFHFQKQPCSFEIMKGVFLSDRVTWNVLIDQWQLLLLNINALIFQ